MQWFVRPLHIGDPIPWRVMFEKIIGLISVRPLARGATVSACTHAQLPIADTVALARQDVRTWVAGKRYIPQQKPLRKDKSLGCPRGDGKCVGVTERFP